jgi:hypothetical protein
MDPEVIRPLVKHAAAEVLRDIDVCQLKMRFKLRDIVDIPPLRQAPPVYVLEAQLMVDTAMNRNHDDMTEFCNVHGIVPARNSFRYCPYEVVVAIFNKMVASGLPEDFIRREMGLRLWLS